MERDGKKASIRWTENNKKTYEIERQNREWNSNKIEEKICTTLRI